jgi:hypothetical protein
MSAPHDGGRDCVDGKRWRTATSRQHANGIAARDGVSPASGSERDPDHSRQISLAIRFCQQQCAGVETPIVHQRVLCVT